MAESSWPTTAGSRAVLDQEYELLAAAWTGNADGIAGYPGDTTIGYADASGRQVKVRSGKRGQVRGRGWYSGTTDTTLSVGANSSGSTRMDLLVLRLTRSTWAITTVVKAGTPGAGNPALTQDATSGITTTGVWEIPLLLITVVNGETSLSSGEVADVAWYMHGNVVVCASTNPYQPSATAYTRLRHSDTNLEYASVAGAWQRQPWHTAWGVIGGQRYHAGITSLLASGIHAETLSGHSSGSITLLANRRYRFHLHGRWFSTTANNFCTVRLRETNISGTVRLRVDDFVIGATANYWYTVDYPVGGSNETKTLVGTLQMAAFGANSYAGDATTMSAILVEDIGPSVPNTVTVI